MLPADILGQVYERFLGKVIRLTPGRQVKIEEKPEVRKAGGVFYTPTYIVDYIVRQTVGPLLEGKTPAQVGARLRGPPERVPHTRRRRDRRVASAHPGRGVRVRLVPAGRVPVPAGLAPGANTSRTPTAG